MLGHPFDLLKTRMQGDLKAPSDTILAKDIIQKDGVVGFYKGGMPNFWRHIVKTAYRDPGRGYCTGLYKREFPTASKEVIALAASFTMSTVDCFAIAPLEKCKVGLMLTRDAKEKSIASYVNAKPTGF